MKKFNKSVFAATLLVVASLATASRALAQEAPQVTQHESAGVTSDGSAPSTVIHGHVASLRHARLQSPVAETDEIKVEVFASAGPLKSGHGFEQFCKTFLTAAMDGTLSSTVGAPDASSFHALTNRFFPEYIMAPTAGSGVVMWNGKVGSGPGGFEDSNGTTIWVAVVMTAKANMTFFPTNIVGQVVSGPNGFLSTLEVFDNPNLVYGDTSRGMYHDSTGTTKYLTGGRWSENGVEKFAFIGIAVSTMNANTQTVSDSNRNWMNNYDNFTLEGTWRITSGGKTYTGTKVLETHPFVEPPLVTPPTLKVEKLADGKVRVSAPGFTGSGKLLRSVDMVVWSAVPDVTEMGVVLNGSTPVDLPAVGEKYFFRLQVLE